MRAICMAAAPLLFAGAAATDTFAAWRARYGKNYGSAEEPGRRACFERSLRDIAGLNARGGGATFAAGPFADKCPEEFLKERVGRPMGTCWKSPMPDYIAPVHTKQSVDWREKGAVTAVKDQGSCGSCWSFSATGNMEGQWFLKKGELLEFSEQELISCDTGAQDNGCKGGGPDTAMIWVIQNGGINTESAYPYASGGGSAPQCDSSKSSTKAGQFDHFVLVPNKNETKLLSALQNEGPISIVLQATNTWQHYSGGIVDAKTCAAPSGSTDHAVLAVGYGFDGSKPYWIVKNSWGKNWGEDGYIRLAANEGGDGTCNMVHCVSTFSVIGGNPHTTAPEPVPPPSPPGPAPGPPGPPPPGPTTMKFACKPIGTMKMCQIDNNGPYSDQMTCMQACH